jgi:hypothetical protein
VTRRRCVAPERHSPRASTSSCQPTMNQSPLPAHTRCHRMAAPTPSCVEQLHGGEKGTPFFGIPGPDALIRNMNAVSSKRDHDARSSRWFVLPVGRSELRPQYWPSKPSDQSNRSQLTENDSRDRLVFLICILEHFDDRPRMAKRVESKLAV